MGNNDIRGGVFAAGGSIYAATSGGLSISTNGGSSWSNYTIAQGLGTNSVRVAYTNSNFIYAGTTGGLSVAAVPGPLPVLAPVAAFGCARRIRRRLRLSTRRTQPS